MASDGSLIEEITHTFYFFPSPIPNFIFSPTELTFMILDSITKTYSLKTTTFPSSNVYISINTTCTDSYSITPDSGTLLANNNELKIKISPLPNRFEGNCTVNHFITTEDTDYSQFSRFSYNIQTINNDKTLAPLLLAAIESDKDNTILISFDRKCYLRNDSIILYKKFNCSNILAITSDTLDVNYCRWLNDKEIILYYNKFNTTSSINHIIAAKPKKIYGNEFSVYYSTGSAVIQLRKIPPKLLSGKYSDDLSSILISYDDSNVNSFIGYGIDINGRKCSEIFKEKELLTSSYCYLDNINKYIVVELSLDSEIIIPLHISNSECVIGQSLTIIDNIIKPTKDSMYFMTGCVNIYEPATTPTITALIKQYPNSGQISYCEDIVLDASVSLVNNKMNGKILKYKWDVSEVDNNILVNYHDLYTYVTNQKESVIKISSELITIRDHNSSFSFSVTLSSVILPQYQSTYSVLINVINDVHNPIIESDYNNNIYMKFYEDRYIKGKSVYELCNNNNNNHKEIVFKYKWKIESFDGDVLIIDSFLTNDPTKLFIKSNLLEVGKYIIQLESTSLVNNVITDTKTTSITLHVEDDELATLKVNSNIKQSIIQNINDPINIILSVIDEGDKDNNHFKYEWSCITSKFEKCKEQNDDLDIIPLELSLNNRNSLYLTNNRLLVSEYIFTIEITGLITSRKSKIILSVTVTDYDIVNEIETVYHLSTNSFFSSPSAYKQNDIIKLKSELEKEEDNDDNNISFEWKYFNDNEVNTLISRNDTHIVYFDCKELNQRITLHLIQLNIYIHNDTEIHTISQYYPFFIISQIPTNGYLQSTITEIRFGDDIFISTSGWKGSEPFTYRFGVILENIEEEKQDNIIYLQTEYSNSNEYNGLLPTGLRHNNYNVNIIVCVKDKYNQAGCSYYNSKGNVLTVKVNPIINIDDIKDKAVLLSNYKDYDEIINLIVGLSIQISIPKTPVVECSSNGILTNGVCVCNDGYIGRLCEKRIPIDGGLSNEFKYSNWSSDCGSVMRYKWRECNNPKPQYGGNTCDFSIETETLVLDPCDDDDDGNNNTEAIYAEWSEWSECDAYCDIYNGKKAEGFQYRTRECIGSKLVCEEKRIETKKCFIECSEPDKLCPGQLIDDNGEIVGVVCSNRGECYTNKDNCGEFEPNCHSWCKCDEGYAGKECQYTTIEYDNIIIENEYILDNLFKYLIGNEIHESVNLYEQQEVIIYNLLDNNYIQNIDEEHINSLFNLLQTQINQMKNKKDNTIPFNIFKSLTNIASNLIDFEWYKINVMNQTNQEYKIGRQLKQYFIDLSILYFNQQYYSNEIVINTNAISIYLSKADISYNNKHNSIGLSDNSIDVYDGLDLSKITEILAIYWNDQYFFTKTEIPSSVLTIILNNEINANTHNLYISLNSANGNKIYYKQRVSRDNEANVKIKCSYINSDNEIISTGSFLVGIIDEEVNSTRYGICISFNTADFIFTTATIEGNIHTVSPIKISNMTGYYNHNNYYILIPMLITIAVLIISSFFAFRKDQEEADNTEYISEKRIKENGTLNIYTEIEYEPYDNIKDTIFTVILNKIKSCHSILAPIFKKSRDLVTIDRFEHILGIAAEVSTLFTVVSLFYSDIDLLDEPTAVICVSTALLIPVNILVPLLYHEFRNYFTRSVKPIKTATTTLWLTIKRVWNIYRMNNYSEIVNEECDNDYSNNSSSVDSSTNPFVISIRSIPNNNNKSAIDKNPFYNLKMYLYSTSGVLFFFNVVFFIIYIVIFKIGIPYVCMYIATLVLILEIAYTFYSTFKVNFIYYVYGLIINAFLLVLDIFFIFFYFEELVNSSMTQSTWEIIYDNGLFKGFVSYAEKNLQCCGYTDKHEYSTQICNVNSIPCKQPLHDVFVQYASLWLIYLFITAILIFLRMILILKIMCFKHSSVGALNVGVINVDVFNTDQTQAVSDIIVYLRFAVTKKKKRRLKESLCIFIYYIIF